MKRSLLGCLALLTLIGCGAPSTSDQGRKSPVPAESAVPAPAPAVAAARNAAVQPSIYELSTRLRDDTGSVGSLDRFRGHPVLITMFYGSCATACPLLTTELKRIERQLPQKVRDDLRVLMVSFDEDRDTPEVLARLKRERGMDGARWTLASASDDEARALSGVLGIKYRKLDNGEFFHSSVIVLLDPQGRPLVRLSGVGEDLDGVVAALTTPSS